MPDGSPCLNGWFRRSSWTQAHARGAVMGNGRQAEARGGFTSHHEAALCPAWAFRASFLARLVTSHFAGFLRERRCPSFPGCLRRRRSRATPVADMPSVSEVSLLSSRRSQCPSHAPSTRCSVSSEITCHISLSFRCGAPSLPLPSFARLRRMQSPSRGTRAFCFPAILAEGIVAQGLVDPCNVVVSPSSRLPARPTGPGGPWTRPPAEG